jgi:hypothetical protein
MDERPKSILDPEFKYIPADQHKGVDGLDAFRRRMREREMKAQLPAVVAQLKRRK